MVKSKVEKSKKLW